MQRSWCGDPRQFAGSELEAQAQAQAQAQKGDLGCKRYGVALCGEA